MIFISYRNYLRGAKSFYCAQIYSKHMKNKIKRFQNFDQFLTQYIHLTLKNKSNENFNVPKLRILLIDVCIIFYQKSTAFIIHLK